MLSYQHAFHAGNHADVIKHLTWLGVIHCLKRKNKPFTLYDTHSGAGVYNLNEDEASKNKEYESGISKLADLSPQSPLLTHYLSLCASYRSHNSYPGSPALSAAELRDGDTLHAMELHPAEYGKLASSIKRISSHATHCHHRDGYEGLKALTPPKPNRGAVLIDPPYERLEEYNDVTNAVTMLLNRWQQAHIVIWYPLLSERAAKKSGASEAMVSQLAALNRPCFTVEVRVEDNTHDAGMYGSGVVVINPPWQLDSIVETAIDEVVPTLGQHVSSEIVWHNEDT